MFRLTVPGVFLLLACGGGGGGGDSVVDSGMVSAACMEATTYQNLANIEDKIFKTSCIFSGCHNGAATDAGRIDLRADMAFTHLVNFDSTVAGDARKLVVPNDPAKSYLLVMIGEIAPGDADPATTDPPATIGFMPQNAGGQLLCPEKRGAIKRWIEMGAQDN
jgi:hypothetical protein